MTRIASSSLFIFFVAVSITLLLKYGGTIQELHFRGAVSRLGKKTEIYVL